MRRIRRFDDRTFRRSLFALTIGLAFVASPAAAQLAGDRMLDQLGADTRAQLRQRGLAMIAPGSPHAPPPGSLESRVWVRFSLERNQVLRQLIQTARQTEYRPELREVRLVEEFENGHVGDYHIRMMLMSVRYRVRHEWDFERGTFWWRLDPDHDNDLAVLDGRWELYRLSDGGTLARFATRIDVGALPEFLQDYATRTKLPESVDHVRKWVDSKGTYRP